MDGLAMIIILLILVVGGVFLFSRFSGRRSLPSPQTGMVYSSAQPPTRRPDDPDQVDEADQIIAAIGGQVRPGDAVVVPISDPEPWGIASFELDLTIAAVSRAEIRDVTGLFSFLIFWMSPGQPAAVLMVEGDVLAMSEVFVGRLLQNDDLINALLWCRDQYLADQEHSQLDFDLSEHGVGTWTAYSAREGDRLRVESGTAELLSASAAAGSGLPYRDFTLRQDDPSNPYRLRLVQVGSYTYLFRGEVMPLRNVTFLRRTRERS
jgi:hypothetical protein